MKTTLLRLALAGAFGLVAAPALADECGSVTGDAVLSARTPQVDVYDGPTGSRLKSIDDDKFPKCLAVVQKAPNGMLQVTIDGQASWVPPNQVNARLGGTAKPICRNLAMGGNDTKVGSTRALGEGCPKPGGSN